MKERIITIINEAKMLLENGVPSDALVEAYGILARTLREGGTVFVCGNGGSAEQAAHFAGELVGRFKKERKGIRAVALGMTTAVLTAWSNDYAYETAFARELETFGRKGDALVALSTSGNSKNVIEAVKKAKEIGMHTVGFFGEGGALAGIVDIALAVPSRDTARIQEIHLLMIHILSEAIENTLY